MLSLSLSSLSPRTRGPSPPDGAQSASPSGLRPPPEVDLPLLLDRGDLLIEDEFSEEGRPSVHSSGSEGSAGSRAYRRAAWAECVEWTGSQPAAWRAPSWAATKGEHGALRPFLPADQLEGIDEADVEGRVCNDDLQEAALRGDLEFMRRLIEAGASVNAPMRSEGGDEYMTLLHVLASKPELPGGAHILAEAVKAEADLNARSSSGTTPLMCACRCKHVGAAEVLLSSDETHLEPVDDLGYNALRYAVCVGHVGRRHGLSNELKAIRAEHCRELVDLLAEAGADLGAGGNAPPILDAVDSLDVPMVEKLLHLGAPPEGLHEAVICGDLYLTKLLTEAQANPFTRDLHGKSVMDLALQRGNEEITTLLRDFVGDLQRQGHPHLQTLTLHPEPHELESNSSGAIWGRRNASIIHIERPDRELWCCGCDLIGLSRRGLRNNLFQGFMFLTLLVALFTPDMWIILDIPSTSALDIILLVVIAIFLLEFAMQLLCMRRSYMCSIFFFMDLVGMLSVLLDMSMVVDALPTAVGGSSMDGALDGVVMRAARTAKLGTRAGRFTKLVKLLRFLPGIEVTEVGAGTSKLISNRFSTRLSTIVSCMIIVVAILVPIFELFVYPTSDHSMRMWADTIAYTALRHPRDMPERIADLDEFYSDRLYFPFELSYTFANGATEWQQIPGAEAPNQRTSKITIESRGGHVTLHFNFWRTRRNDSWCNCAVLFVILCTIMCFALFLSNSITAVLQPLDEFLTAVHKLASTMFKSVTTMAGQMGPDAAQRHEDEYSEEESAGEEHRLSDEIRVLQKVARKLTVLNEIRTSTQMDSETLGRMEETQREVIREFATATTSMPSCYTLGSTTQALGSMASQEVLGAAIDEDDDPYEVTMEIRVSLEDVNMRLTQLRQWDLDVLALSDSQCEAVCVAALRCHRATGSARQLGDGSQGDLYRAFVAAVARGYKPREFAAYHNWSHATDVVLALLSVLDLGAAEHYLSGAQRFALVVSALGHDMGHLGLTNVFLIETQHGLALRYNDSSPLENMHCARLFEVSRQAGTEIFTGLTDEQLREARGIIVESILHTDLAHNSKLVKAMRKIGDEHKETLALAEMLLLSGQMDFPSKEVVEICSAAHGKRELCAVLLHFCDVSNPMKPWRQCMQWASLLTEEFSLQGYREKELGLPVSPLNDTGNGIGEAYAQIGFIEFFVAPLAFSVQRLVPTLGFCTFHLAANMRSWIREWAETADPPPSVADLQRLTERAWKLFGALGEDASAHLEEAESEDEQQAKGGETPLTPLLALTSAASGLLASAASRSGVL